ncbi:MAG: isoprenyl transferase [Deltaproteobacteria bacterium]|nr:isoprenyl transferase [Deltaproteobacteria bacterium]
MNAGNIDTLPRERFPRHIAIIMDGNGRWAAERRRNRLFGHRHGINAVREAVRECRRLNISHLTLYAFSMENWKRPPTEVAGLWRLLKSYVQTELKELRDNGVRLNVIGRVELIPKDVRDAIDYTLRETAACRDMVLTIALSYGSRDEILTAVRDLARRVKAESLDADAIDEQTIDRALWTADMPDPDLLIRTSGEFRISNFLLWQLAYTEIHVTPTLWPDFSKKDLHAAILDFAGRERRFGLTGEQIKKGMKDEG